MAFLSINNVEIRGIACAVPKNIEKVADLPYLTDTEVQNFVNVTGVRQGRITSKGVTCSDICQAAAEKLLLEAGWEKESIDLLAYVSLSRDFFILPNTSNILQDKLGLSEHCMAIDLPFACSGYVHGLSVAASLLQNGSIKRALLLVGETSSALQSPLDKTNWPLFGDAGSATLLEYNPDAKHPMQFNFGSDGSGYEAIINREMGVRYPTTEDSLKVKQIEDGIRRAAWQTEMDGMAVFSFSITKTVKSMKQLTEHFGFDMTKVDYLLLHQASKMIDERIRIKMKLTEEQVPYSLDEFANTSSCSVPLTMVTKIREELQNKENDLAMCVFGAGLSWGSAHLFTNNLICPELIEID